MLTPLDNDGSEGEEVRIDRGRWRPDLWGALVVWGIYTGLVLFGDGVRRSSYLAVSGGLLVLLSAWQIFTPRFLDFSSARGTLRRRYRLFGLGEVTRVKVLGDAATFARVLASERSGPARARKKWLGAVLAALTLLIGAWTSSWARAPGEVERLGQGVGGHGSALNELLDSLYGRLGARLGWPRAAIGLLAFDHSGAHIASVSSDGLFVWRVAGAEALVGPLPLPGALRSLQFSKDGAWVMGEDDGGVWLWSMADLEAAPRRLRRPTLGVWSQRLLPNAGGVVMWSEAGEYRLWYDVERLPPARADRLEGGAEIRKQTQQCVTADGKILMAWVGVSQRRCCGSADHEQATIRVQDLGNSVPVVMWPLHKIYPTWRRPRMLLSANCRWLWLDGAADSREEEAPAGWLIELTGGLAGLPTPISRGSLPPARWLAWSGDGGVLISERGLFDVDARTYREWIEPISVKERDRAQSSWVAPFNQSWVATARTCRAEEAPRERVCVDVIDARSARLIRRFEGHSGALSSFAASPSGGSLATGSQDQTIRVWGVRDASP